MVKIRKFIGGDEADIFVPIHENKSRNIDQFIRNLQLRDKKRLFETFERFVKTGFIPNKTKFRYEHDGIFAFKAGQVRILCMYLPDASGRAQLLLHGYMKKTDKLPEKEFKKAKQLAIVIEEEGYGIED